MTVHFYKVLLVFCFYLPSLCMGSEIAHPKPAIEYDPNISKIEKTDEEWAKLLTPEQYNILRKGGTERAHTGQYDKFYQKGTYICVACGNPLFNSTAKFDSKTGWPSFYEPVHEDSVGTQTDYTLFFIPRTEVHCKRCGGHLGHVFKDGPPPTGLRYCINSISLSYIAKK